MTPTDAALGERAPRPPPSRGRFEPRSRATQVGLAALVGVFIVTAAQSPMDSSLHGDGYYTYLFARTIVFDGDLDFHEDYRLCGDPWGLARTPIGDDVNYWNLGPSVFWAPILAFDRLTGHPALESNDPATRVACRGPMAERALQGSLFAGLLTLLFGFVVARRYVSSGAALFGAAGIGLLGSLLYYSTMLLSYGHAASSCASGLAVVAWAVYRERPTLRGWLAMGAALGLAMLTRAQDAVLVILPLGTWLAFAWRYRTSQRKLLVHIGYGLLFTAALFVFFFPQLWFWHESTGSWVTVPQGSGYMRWGGSMPHKALFSAQGLFAWTPIHYLAVAGFVALALRHRTRALGIAMLALFLLEAYVVGAAYDWNGSVGFPGRRFDALVVPSMLGLAAFGAETARWARVRPWRLLAASGLALVLVFGAVNLAVSVAVAGGMRTDISRPSHGFWEDVTLRSARPLWTAIGNPFTWPASLPFALRYRVHPRRWDVVGGAELFHHDERTVRWRHAESTLELSSPIVALYVDGSVDARPSEVRGRRGLVAFPGRSRVLLPLHSPELGFIAVRATPLSQERPVRLGVSLAGVRLGSARVPSVGGEEVRFAVPVGAAQHGINELWLWVEGGSVLLERIQLLDPIPPPSDTAREENQRLLEERRALTGRRPT